MRFIIPFLLVVVGCKFDTSNRSQQPIDGNVVVDGPAADAPTMVDATLDAPLMVDAMSDAPPMADAPLMVDAMSDAPPTSDAPLMADAMLDAPPMADAPLMVDAMSDAPPMADAPLMVDAMSDAPPMADAPLMVDAMVDAPPMADASPPTVPMVMITEVSYTDLTDQWIELTNTTQAPIPLGGWQLCGASFKYWPLPAIVLNAGETMLVRWNKNGNNNLGQKIYYTGTVNLAPLGDGSTTVTNDKSMAVYKMTPFTDSNNIVSFLQWMQGSQARADVASSAGIWALSDFVAATPVGSSICYTGGDPTNPQSFVADSTPTPNAANGGCQ